MAGARPIVAPGEPPRVGRFRIAAIIGEGTASTVYLAMDTREGAWRALKVLGFAQMGDERARSRFKREVDAVRSIAHPYILKAHDADPEDPFTPWIAYEVCEAGTVQDWLDLNGPMPSFLAVDVMTQVCDALDAGHRVGIAQGRLTPAKILVDRQGKCRLKGFRRVLPASSGGFSADSVDLRDDIVAAGGLLHALLTTQPYVEGGPANGLPDPLRDAVLACMDRGRGARFPDAAALGRELEAALLEVSLPGTVPSLADRDATIPSTVEEIFDPSSSFADLERAARWAEDPSAGPQRPERSATDMLRMLNGPLAAQTRASSPLGEGAPRRGAAVRSIPLAAPRAPSPVASPGGTAAQSPSNRVPSYLVEEPAPKRAERWREATPPPARRIHRQPPEPVVDPRWGVAGLMVAVSMGVGLLVWSGVEVGKARKVAFDAAEGLAAVVDAEAALVTELVARGADRGVLEARFFAYRDAAGRARYGAAEAYAVTVLEQAARVGVDPRSPLLDEPTRRVAAVDAARTRYLQEREAWRQVAQGFPGVLTTTIGWSAAPEE